jgi:DNA modification methylase
VLSRLETQVLYCADNLFKLREFPSASVDLIYLDPPFFSNRRYEVIWGDEAEVRSFEDVWSGGIDAYIEWIEKRILELRRVLSDNGSIYLHCDPHANHYLKVLMDQVFGRECFRSEIVWKRTGAHGATKGYAPVHDCILYYARPGHTWNVQFHQYRSEYLADKYKYSDARGRYQLITLVPQGTRNGETGQPWRGINPTARGVHWRYAPAKLEELDQEGMIYWAKGGKGLPRLKRYLDESAGVPVQDVWTDISPINSQAQERLGYPTQKPEQLLERIIQASSQPDDVVLDPFCGCGTTVSVAERLGRRWIGIDISPTAVNLMIRRLKKYNSGLKFHTQGLPITEADLRSLRPFEFQNWVIQKFNGTHSLRKSGDMGIDGYSFMLNEPIQVKQSERVGRNVVDNFETAVRRAGATAGYIVAFSFAKGAIEEAARARRTEKIDIRLVTIKKLLSPDASNIVVGLATVTDLPLPPSRRANQRPDADELIRSDKLETA